MAGQNQMIGHVCQTIRPFRLHCVIIIINGVVANVALLIMLQRLARGYLWPFRTFLFCSRTSNIDHIQNDNRLEKNFAYLLLLFSLMMNEGMNEWAEVTFINIVVLWSNGSECSRA